MLSSKLQQSLKRIKVQPVDNLAPIDNKLILDKVVAEVVKQYIEDIKDVIFDQVTNDFKKEVGSMVKLVVAGVEKGAKGQDADENKILNRVLEVMQEEKKSLKSEITREVIAKFPDAQSMAEAVSKGVRVPKDGKTPVYGVDFTFSKEQISDSPQEVVDKLNTTTDSVNMEVIKGLKKTLKGIHSQAQGSKTSQGGGGGGYGPGGTDVALADGGTGTSLTDPDADRIMMWDDSLGAVTWLTAGTGLTISGTTITSAGGGLTWTEVTDTSATMAINNGYIANNAALVTLTLPDTAAVGDVVRIVGKGAGLFSIAQNASESINFGNVTTTVGVGGSITATHRYDAIELICVTANTTWNVMSVQGNLTYV